MKRLILDPFFMIGATLSILGIVFVVFPLAYFFKPEIEEFVPGAILIVVGFVFIINALRGNKV